MPCSLYIDDRHNGELQFKNYGLSADVLISPSDEQHFAAAKSAVFLAAYTLTLLGYTLGLKKCVFTPQKRKNTLVLSRIRIWKLSIYLITNSQVSFLS